MSIKKGNQNTRQHVVNRRLKKAFEANPSNQKKQGTSLAKATNPTKKSGQMNLRMSKHDKALFEAVGSQTKQPISNSIRMAMTAYKAALNGKGFILGGYIFDIPNGKIMKGKKSKSNPKTAKQ